ncbi:hypothetical protein KAI32_04425, partial [Candidatus Pacearchaeota archaeon]|nr:hypothetical protein [Candidatus Pacearchaeota archaeon]
EIELADLDEIKKSVAEAKKESEKAEAKIKVETKDKTEVKKDTTKELEEKQVQPLILDNGLMVSSLKEMKNVLQGLDDEIFKIHVNENKNDIAKWFEQYSKTFAARLKSLKNKEELLKEIVLFKGGEEKTKPVIPPKEPATKTKPTLKTK